MHVCAEPCLVTATCVVLDIWIYTAKHVKFRMHGLCPERKNHAYQLTLCYLTPSALPFYSSFPSRHSHHVVDGDVSQAAMLCLLCGKMLCTNSYCCMFEVEDGSQLGRNCTSALTGEIFPKTRVQWRLHCVFMMHSLPITAHEYSFPSTCPLESWLAFTRCLVLGMNRCRECGIRQCK